MTNDDELLVEDKHSVRWIRLHRPRSKNGLTVEVNARIRAALESATSDGVRVLVFTGSDGNFCSGLDLRDAMARGPIPADRREGEIREHFHSLIRALRAFEGPTVAAVDGAAAGFGCDLALACDIRLASTRARFGELFVRRGLIPDGGSSYHLPRLVGIGRALDMMLTGEVVEAEEAHRIGLVTRLYEQDEYEQAVETFVERLAKGPPLVHKLIKQNVYATFDSDLDTALDREAVGQAKCLGSSDFAEGIAAFLTKREPVFKGE